MNLEHLIAVHSWKNQQFKHCSRQMTLFLSFVCLIFFGMILSYSAMSVNYNSITGMAFYVSSNNAVVNIGNGFITINDFISSVRTSPQVTQIKLFFYTLWILIVLVGTAIYYEFQRVN